MARNLGPEFEQLRTKTDAEVCKYIGGFNEREGLGYRLIGQHELQRRLQRPEALRSWIAIAISTVAIILSLIQFFLGWK